MISSGHQRGNVVPLADDFIASDYCSPFHVEGSDVGTTGSKQLSSPRGPSRNVQEASHRLRRLTLAHFKSGRRRRKGSACRVPVAISTSEGSESVSLDQAMAKCLAVSLSADRNDRQVIYTITSRVRPRRQAGHIALDWRKRTAPTTPKRNPPQP